LTDEPLAENSILQRIQALDTINAAMRPTSKELLAKSYERDQELSSLIKLARGEACQICGYYFLRPDGKRYVECHHLEHLANEGLDCSKNILVVCANHHRQRHYGTAKILSHTSVFIVIEIDGMPYTCGL
jgi:predicted HNH restriction endonuclease